MTLCGDYSRAFSAHDPPVFKALFTMQSHPCFTQTDQAYPSSLPFFANYEVIYEWIPNVENGQAGRINTNTEKYRCGQTYCIGSAARVVNGRVECVTDGKRSSLNVGLWVSACHLEVCTQPGGTYTRSLFHGVIGWYTCIACVRRDYEHARRERGAAGSLWYSLRWHSDAVKTLNLSV